jgi:hypothetical protein
MLDFSRFVLIVAFGALINPCSAQDSSNVISLKHSAKLFTGKWQLIKTFDRGEYRLVAKADYDDVIEFKPHHHFTEEVFYESNHWIIEGRWNVDTKTGKLLLTQRHYTSGKLEDHPQDIVLDVILLNTENWAGRSSIKNQQVKVYYSRILKR